jgi:hypothetical protein
MKKLIDFAERFSKNALVRFVWFMVGAIAGILGWLFFTIYGDIEHYNRNGDSAVYHPKFFEEECNKKKKKK